MAKQGGYGAIVKITVSAALVAVASILDVEFPEFTAEVEDVTAHDSPGGWAEFIKTGRRNLGDFSMTLLWDKAAATHAAIITAFNANPTVNMSIQDPGGAEIIAFAGHITQLGRMSKQKEGYKCKVKVQPTGAPTITP